MAKYILAHDLGTSGDKATLFSEHGKLVGSQVSSYETDYFNGNWAEQDADDWWQAVCISSKNLIQSLNVNSSDIAAISFSGQMMGCLCVDKDGNPLRKSIIWADQRAGKQVEQIEEHISQKEFYNIVGHRNTPSYGIQKLMWVRDNEPDIYKKTYKTLNAKDYIVFKLTGRFYTDFSDGNSNACYDIKNWKWSDKIIEAAGIDPDKLPELKPSTYVAGGVTKYAAELTGLAEGTPVVLGAGDGVTASVGAGSIAPGKTYCCMGTSAWITTTSEEPIFDEDMRSVNWAHAIEGLYAPNGTMQYAGGSYSWVKNNLCEYESYLAEKNGTSPYNYMNEQIEKSPVGSNGIIFLPYLIGERAPRWNPNAKGSFIGIKAENSKGDILRSVLEGATMNLAIILEILRKKVSIEEILIIGGGAKGAIWREIMADIYNANIKVPSHLEEAGSMGAAVIGGVGVGLFENFSVIDRFINIVSEHTPNPEAVAEYEPIKGLYEDCYVALEPIFDRMAKRN